MGLALSLEDYHPSVLLHCWLGHLTCKIVSEMTYNVLSGTLNLQYHTLIADISAELPPVQVVGSTDLKLACTQSDFLSVVKSLSLKVICQLNTSHQPIHPE